MSKELIVKKCKSCGATIRVVNDCKCPGCGIVCCNESMGVLVPNSVDAAAEKHVPTYEIKGDRIEVKVNHVMEEEHYIEWISMVNDNEECIVYFKSGMEAKADFKYVPGSVVYAYCNKHELWKTDIK